MSDDTNSPTVSPKKGSRPKFTSKKSTYVEKEVEPRIPREQCQPSGNDILATPDTKTDTAAEEERSSDTVKRPPDVRVTFTPAYNRDALKDFLESEIATLWHKAFHDIGDVKSLSNAFVFSKRKAVVTSMAYTSDGGLIIGATPQEEERTNKPFVQSVLTVYSDVEKGEEVGVLFVQGNPTDIIHKASYHRAKLGHRGLIVAHCFEPDEGKPYRDKGEVIAGITSLGFRWEDEILARCPTERRRVDKWLVFRGNALAACPSGG